jgi:hypothetical protein
MAKKKPAKTDENLQRPFRLGDEVRIRHFGFPGRIVELRGHIGAGGRELFRVLFKEEPDPAFIEVPAEEMILVRAVEDIVPESQTQA